MKEETLHKWLHGMPETTKPGKNRAKYLIHMGWLMGLEPTTTGITILDSTN